jgi:hypothetical protein
VKDYSEYLQSRRGNLQGIKNADATPELPITEVSYDDATDFCKWLSSKEGRNYRLPTDEEWSTAVGLPPESGKNPKEKSEKGDLEIYPWGNYYPPNKEDGNYGLTQIGRDSSFKYADDGYEETAPVMSFKPNKFGIFDMGGNVREWCLDWFDEKQDTRVTRGTSYFYLYTQEAHRSSLRFGQKPQQHDIIHGFRCVIGSLIKENDQSKHSVISDVATARMSMTPSSESKKGGSPLNLPRVENDMLSANQKRQLEQTARAFGKDPHELIQETNELAKKLQHDMMYPEDRGLREREESRRKSGFYGPGQ